MIPGKGHMMRFSAAVIILSFLSVPVWAQSDTRGLVDRLDRLERDLTSLQSQVYRGQSGRSSSSAASGDQAGVSGNAYAMLDDRIGKIEEQLRDLTGQIEKNQFALSQLTAKLDRAQTDNDFRLKQLEEKQNNAAAALPPPPLEAAKGADSNADRAPGAPPGFLVHPGDKPSAPATPPPAGGKSAAEQFDSAFALLRNSDYDGATKGFQTFLAQHPTDPLAGNAAYWLGQIAFAQGRYDQAAVIFLDAYQKYPKSAKASESLLKVGLSMGNLDKKKEACAALHRFQSEYPDASDSLKRQAAAERQKQGC